MQPALKPLPIRNIRATYRKFSKSTTDMPKKHQVEIYGDSSSVSSSVSSVEFAYGKHSVTLNFDENFNMLLQNFVYKHAVDFADFNFF